MELEELICLMAASIYAGKGKTVGGRIVMREAILEAAELRRMYLQMNRTEEI